MKCNVGIYVFHHVDVLSANQVLMKRNVGIYIFHHTLCTLSEQVTIT